MVRQTGQEYPERALMATLSDLLGIPHFTTSNGGTVRRDFLEAVADELGAAYHGQDKDGLIRSVWEAANQVDMPPDRLSRGGTVTNQVLQEVVDGVLRHGVPGRVEPSPPAGDEDLADLTGIEDLESMLDPSTLGDERTRRLAQIARREGQDMFRQQVLDAYGARCAVTGFDDPMTLQAAHIVPYRGPRSNTVTNGLCLRADLHILFDRGAFAVHEQDTRLLVKPHLMVGSYASVLGDALFTPPRARRDRPSAPALRAHRLWAGFLD